MTDRKEEAMRENSEESEERAIENRNAWPVNPRSGVCQIRLMFAS
jgi:hypothetical protein